METTDTALVVKGPLPQSFVIDTCQATLAEKPIGLRFKKMARPTRL
jgi:hypothetical protein